MCQIPSHAKLKNCLPPSGVGKLEALGRIVRAEHRRLRLTLGDEPKESAMLRIDIEEARDR
jgi:hypothetical protein